MSETKVVMPKMTGDVGSPAPEVKAPVVVKQNFVLDDYKDKYPGITDTKTIREQAAKDSVNLANVWDITPLFGDYIVATYLGFVFGGSIKEFNEMRRGK